MAKEAHEVEEEPTDYTFDRTKTEQSYSNFMLISSSPEEVFLEFGFKRLDAPNTIEVSNRIVLSIPQAIKVRDAFVEHMKHFKVEIRQVPAEKKNEDRAKDE